MGSNDYVYTNAVIDPITKGNIDTYVVKENVPVSFLYANLSINPKNVILNNYYYRNIKGKNVKIRCIDTPYTNGRIMPVVQDKVYNVLRATNRIDGCLFIFEFNYQLNGSDEMKTKRFAFKVVPEKEFKMYHDIEVVKDIEKRAEEKGEIIRPRKQS